MKASWSVVAGLCALSGCAPADDAAPWASVRDSAPAQTPARISVEPGMVTLPSTSVGKATMASVRLRNEGDSAAQVLLGIPEPFTVALTAVSLPPASEQNVDLRLDPVRPGNTGAVLLVQFDGRRIEIAVRAEVAAASATPGPENLTDALPPPPPTR